MALTSGGGGGRADRRSYGFGVQVWASLLRRNNRRCLLLGEDYHRAKNNAGPSSDSQSQSGFEGIFWGTVKRRQLAVASDQCEGKGNGKGGMGEECCVQYLARLSMGVALDDVARNPSHG